MNEVDQDAIIIKLVKEFCFWESTAYAFIESEGRCVYCGENLYSDRLHYYAQNIDHIFPRSKYPDLANLQSNLVLSCFKCNSLKRDRDLCPETDDPHNLLENNKERAIEYVRNQLKDDIQWQIDNCEELNKILPWVHAE